MGRFCNVSCDAKLGADWYKLLSVDITRDSASRDEEALMVVAASLSEPESCAAKNTNKINKTCSYITSSLCHVTCHNKEWNG